VALLIQLGLGSSERDDRVATGERRMAVTTEGRRELSICCHRKADSREACGEAQIVTGLMILQTLFQTLPAKVVHGSAGDRSV